VFLRETGQELTEFAVSDVSDKLRRLEATPSQPSQSSTAPTQGVQASGSVRILYEVCPLCGGEELAFHKEGNCTKHPCYNSILPPTMYWKRCDSCGHIFTEGYFTPEAANIIFSKTMPHQAVGHNMEAQRVVSARIVGRVAPYAPKEKMHCKYLSDSKLCFGDWLDVGFGNASLVFTAAEWGFHAVGLDLREENVNALTALEHEAYCKPIEALDFPERFSVISMADVLEHIPYPATALKAAHRLLQPHGALFISMPNMDTFIWRSLDAANANPYWGEIEHYHNFSRARLYTFLEKHGFSAVSYNISERYRACMEVIALKNG
jgi:SAM-dependent methyltransferase